MGVVVLKYQYEKSDGNQRYLLEDTHKKKDVGKENTGTCKCHAYQNKNRRQL